MSKAAVDEYLRTARQLDALAGEPADLLVELRRHQEELRFETVSLDTTWRIGTVAREIALAERLPLAIEIMLGVQQVFHAATPGASADNDSWAHRKGNVVDRYLESSLAVWAQYDGANNPFDTGSRLPVGDYVAAGGGFPLFLTTGVSVGHICVSGLPMIHDHALVVAALRTVLAEDRAAHA